MQQQICVAASSTDSTLVAWDSTTGRVLGNYKEASCGPNALSSLGQDYLLAAQSSTKALQLWSWGKEQRLHRCFVVEQMQAVTATQDGTYVLAGGTSGSVYVWEAATGRLLRSWPAHFKAVTCLACSDGGRVLLSAAQDTLVHAFVLMDVLDISTNPAGSATPLHTWSEHTLPVTALACGAGIANPLAVSAALDCHCHIRSIATGELLRTISLPCALHAVALDPTEHALYLGGSDGRVFDVSLVGPYPPERPPASQQQPAPANGHAPGFVFGHAGHDETVREMRGHSHAVRSLAVTPDGASLLSGCDAGSVHVWDVRTRQTLRVLTHPAKGPVTCLLSLACPPALAARHSSTLPSPDQKQLQPLAPLAKHLAVDSSGLASWEGPTVKLHGSAVKRSIALESGLVEAPYSDSQPSSIADSSTHMQHAQQLQDLQQRLDNAELAAQQWQQQHQKLHEFCTQQLMGSSAS